jgi:hypothetical protein
LAADRKVLILAAARYLFYLILKIGLVVRVVRSPRLEIRIFSDKPASPALGRAVIVPNNPAPAHLSPVRDAQYRD